MSKYITQRCVDRDQQIGEVEKRLNAIRLGQTVFDSILEWYGIPGIGKTTLAQGAIAGLCEKKKIPFACLDFDPKKNDKASKIPGEPILLLEDILEGIGTGAPIDFEQAVKKYRQAPDEDLRAEREKKVLQEFLHHVYRLLENDPVVLIFDTTDKVEPDVAAWVEENVISPLCLKGKCLVIWTGRFPQRWRRFEVRRRVVSSRLDPLPREATVEQVGPIEVDVYRFTFGHPMGNERLSEAISRFEKEKQTFGERDLINVVNRVIDEYVMQGILPELNAACRALAVVRQFDVIILRRILSEFVSHFKDIDAYLKVIGQLTETSLVEWDAVRKGYALDETLRHILALHLRLNQPERYSAINEVASKIYDEWIERVRENRSVYVLERLYHQASIAGSRGETQSYIADKLHGELQGYLGKYYRDGDREFAISSATQLYQEMRRDNELREIVGEQGFSRLEETVNSHRLTLAQGKS